MLPLSCGLCHLCHPTPSEKVRGGGSLVVSTLQRDQDSTSTSIGRLADYHRLSSIRKLKAKENPGRLGSGDQAALPVGVLSGFSWCNKKACLSNRTSQIVCTLVRLLLPSM